MWRTPPCFAMTASEISERARDFRNRRRKTDKRLLTIAVLGTIQILLGLSFFAIGAWALVHVLSEVHAMIGCPFWIGGASFLSGYLAVIVRSSYKNIWITAACISSIVSFFVTLASTAWAFVRIVVYKRGSGDPLLFYGLLISTSILQVFVTALTSAVTWLAKEYLAEREERVRRLDRPRLSQFGIDNYFPPPPEEWAPPPYAP